MTLASGLTATRQAGAHPLAHYRGEFPIFRDKIYLNTCSLGALGVRTRRRIAEFLDLWQERGASAWYDVWWAALGEWRRRYARVIAATPEEIALGPSISVALASVAEALDYGKRRRVVVTSLDFPTVAYQWLAKRARGIELVVVESPDEVTVPVEMIARAVDERTALVATSHGYFTSGAIQDFAPGRLEFHDDARRFELGPPALAPIYAQLGGLDSIDEIGVPAIRGVAAALTEDLIASARERGFQPKVAAHPQQRSAIVMLPAADPAARVRLLAEAGIVADARPGHVRLSPFFYNVQDDHVAALERLDM